MRQQVHNNLMNAGEDFLILQVFRDGGTDEIDVNQIASICLSKDSPAFDGIGNTPSEADSASTFDTAAGFGGEASCIVDDDVDTATQGKAKIGALNFDYDANVGGTGTHIITNIGICQGDSGGGSSTNLDCEDAQSTPVGILFAQIDIADFTLATPGEQAQIDYTFDISSDLN